MAAIVQAEELGENDQTDVQTNQVEQNSTNQPAPSPGNLTQSITGQILQVMKRTQQTMKVQYLTKITRQVLSRNLQQPKRLKKTSINYPFDYRNLPIQKETIIMNFSRSITIPINPLH